MRSLQITQISDSLPVSHIVQLDGTDFYRIYGEDFRFVERVLLNDIEAPSFAVENKTTLLVTLPFPRDQLREVMVLSSSVTLTERSLVRMSLRGGFIEGISRLVQRFTRKMLQTPGTDIFAPEDGGGLYALVGTAVSATSISDLVAQHNLVVTRTSEQIQKLQAQSDRYIPASERLVGVEVMSVDFDRDTSTLRSRVLLRSAGGDALLNLATV
jgi:hypothetical protein